MATRPDLNSASRAKLPSIYTVKTLDDGTYQPMRNGAPHFEAFADFISAHLACKVAENRQAVRYARLRAEAL